MKNRQPKVPTTPELKKPRGGFCFLREAKPQKTIQSEGHGVLLCGRSGGGGNHTQGSVIALMRSHGV